MAAADWSEKTKLLLTAGVVVVLNLGVWYVVYTARAEDQKLEAQWTSIKKAVAELRKKGEARPEKQNELKKLVAQNERKLKKLPELGERDVFLLKLGDMADQFKLDLKGNTIERDRRPNDIPGINPQDFMQDVWRMNYESDFKGLCEFLNHFEEHYPRFVTFENVTLTPRDNGMNVTGAKHNVNFDVVTYRFVGGAGE